MEESLGEILAFTDADCEPPPVWLARIDQLFGNGPVADWVQWIDEERWQSLMPIDPVAFCDTRNLALRREVLATVPFDQSFRQAGDIDLGIRLFERGIPIRMEPALRLLHDHPVSIAAVLRRAYRRGRGLAKLDRKHGRRARPTGQRPLRIGEVDVKAAVLGWSGRPGFGLVALPLVSVALVPTLAALSVLARVPSAAARGRRLFVVFERLSLLLGRLVG